MLNYNYSEYSNLWATMNGKSLCTTYDNKLASRYKTAILSVQKTRVSERTIKLSFEACGVTELCALMSRERNWTDNCVELSSENQLDEDINLEEEDDESLAAASADEMIDDNKGDDKSDEGIETVLGHTALL